GHYPAPGRGLIGGQTDLAEPTLVEMRFVKWGQDRMEGVCQIIPPVPDINSKVSFQRIEPSDRKTAFIELRIKGFHRHETSQRIVGQNDYGNACFVCIFKLDIGSAKIGRYREGVENFLNGRGLRTYLYRNGFRSVFASVYRIQPDLVGSGVTEPFHKN